MHLRFPPPSPSHNTATRDAVCRSPRALLQIAPGSAQLLHAISYNVQGASSGNLGKFSVKKLRLKKKKKKLCPDHAAQHLLTRSYTARLFKEKL